MSPSTVTENRVIRPLLLAFLLLIPATLMAVVASGAGALPGDVTVARAVQDAGIPGAEQLAWFGWVLGGTPAATALTLAVALMLYLRGRTLPSIMLVVTAVVLHANYAIKWMVESPRPTAEQVRVTEEANFYGFPSGHVMTAMLVYGAIFFLAPVLTQRASAQKLIRGLAVFAILITSFGRVYSGAHWPSDVGGGYLWGSVTLLLLIGAYRAAPDSWGTAFLVTRVPTPRRDAPPAGSRTPELT
jgi:membrane-associated phospholipid phosphatase